MHFVIGGYGVAVRQTFRANSTTDTGTHNHVETGKVALVDNR
jgi:hypothetical protein